ncbi:MAG: ABC transporter substrate-binding protein [Actinomycetota bacterium]|nr:ABC transporter substrate-binding protein [Actinomycetota bacterium]
MATAALSLGVALLVAGCGGGGGNEKAATTTGGGKRGGTMTLVANAAPSGSPDPAINYTLQEWQLLIFTHDGLTAFKRVGGKEGTKLVPDLAQAIPKPQAGGRTWTFKLRPNIKFADGTVVKPSDFTRTFERMFKVHGPTTGTFYNVIKGADACLKKAATCDLSQGVVANDSANTVTFHLTSPDPEWLYKLALPFAFVLPKSTPDKEVHIPPPGTGPYKFAQYDPNKQMKLVRNPYFKEWSKDAQPNGNPDVIVEKFGLSVEAEVTQVENGQADWMFDIPPADRLPEISSKYADQVKVNPLTAVWYMALNVRIPPFNNLKARQAVNYAADHDALVKIYGGPKLAVPTCQILPPNFPGYEPYCPYTKNPGSGKWTAPDMAKAQRLMNESGTKGQKVAVVTDTPNVDRDLGLYFVSLLNKLGYKASLKALSSDVQYPYCQNSKNKVQICFSSWYQDYPAASDFINVLLGCESFRPNSNASPNLSEYCVKSTQAKIDQALELGITNPDKANEMWGDLDKLLVDQAVWVPMFNPKYIDFLSKRVRGYQFSPQWYFLIDQAWLEE